MIRFIIVLLAVALGIFLTVTFVLHAHPSFLYQTLILLVFSTALIYSYLIRAAKPGLFIPLYLLTMAIKMLGYGGYMFAVIIKDNAGAVDNVIFFMVSYFIFTALEVAFLYPRISGRD